MQFDYLVLYVQLLSKPMRHTKKIKNRNIDSVAAVTDRLSSGERAFSSLNFWEEIKANLKPMTVAKVQEWVRRTVAR